MLTAPPASHDAEQKSGRDVAMSPELALVCACCAWPPTPARAKSIRQAATHPAIDDTKLAQVAIRHGVAGLVAQGLRTVQIPVVGRLQRAATRSGMAALRQANEALRLQQLLLALGIPVLVLKGTSLAHCAYGAIGLRDAVDIDLAVSPAHVEQAWHVLEAAGYETIIPHRRLSGSALGVFRWAAKDSYHRHRAHGFVVELHWRLSDDLADPAPPPPEQWQKVEVAPGCHLRALGDDALFVYACVHGAAHLWARLKWLADIGALIERSDDGGAGYWAAAKGQGAERAAASALVLAHRLLGVPFPAGFVMPGSLRLRLLLAMATRAIIAGGGGRDHAGTPFRGWGELTAKLLIAHRPGHALATVRRVLVSSEDVGLLALPSSLVLLYPVVRIPLLIARRARRAARRRRKT